MLPKDYDTLKKYLRNLFTTGEYEKLLQHCSFILQETGSTEEQYRQTYSDEARYALRRRFEGLRSSGSVYQNRGDVEKALETFQKALDIAELIHEKEDIAKAQYSIGTLYKVTGQLESALEWYQKSQVLCKEVQLQELEAGILNGIASVYRHLAQYPEALSSFQDALDIAEEINNIEMQSISLLSIGNVYSELGQDEYAIQYYKKSLPCFEKTNNVSNMAGCYTNLASSYGELKHYNQAQRYIEMSIELCKQHNFRQLLATNYLNSANNCINLKEYERSILYAQKSISILEKVDDREGIAFAKAIQGMANCDQDNPHRNIKEAWNNYLQALDIADESSIGHLQLEISSKLIPILKECGEHEKALDYALKFIELSKEQKGEDIAKAIQAEALRFQEREVKILNEKNAEIHKANEKLERSVKELEQAYVMIDSANHSLEKAYEATDEAKRNTEKLLHNILPTTIASELSKRWKTIVQASDAVTVVFIDIVGFTVLSQTMTPEDLVSILDKVFRTFDTIAKRYGVEKIKTIGDCYMAVGGLPEPDELHARNVTLFAFDVLQAIKDFNKQQGTTLNVRVGINSGRVVAGVIGQNKFAYDLWGDTVNTASRMESHGEKGRVHCSESTVQLLKHQAPEILAEKRGEIHVKGKGVMQTYFL